MNIINHLNWKDSIPTFSGARSLSIWSGLIIHGSNFLEVNVIILDYLEFFFPSAFFSLCSFLSIFLFVFEAVTGNLLYTNAYWNSR